MLALAAASRTWWESIRPQGWAVDQHLADSTAGCNETEEELALVKAVATWLRQSAWELRLPVAAAIPDTGQ